MTVTVTSDPVDLAGPPRLATGAELLGQLKDSGFAEPPSLVRRADGQVIQLPKLMYLVVSLLDGVRGPGDIARAASERLGRTLTAEQVSYLVSVKLMPLGLIAGAGPSASAPTASPLLALRARLTLLPEAAAAAAGTFLRPLFRWPVIVAVLGSVGVLDYWVWSVNGLAAAFRQVLADPLQLLVVAGLSVASALFHECGHAAGCRYSGARPGRIGVGLYLVWPSFFTNVTDSYRLSRTGRLRTDLGGIYFNLIFIVVLAGLYNATSAPILLLVIAITHLEMLEQLMPFVRFDGYFILSDLVGVPDLFGRVAPVLRAALAHRRPGADEPQAAGLRPAARKLITGWVLAVIPLLLVILVCLLLHLPAANRALWHSAAHAARLAGTDLTGHRYAAAAADALGGALAALTVGSTVYVLVQLLRRALSLGTRWSAGRPARRLAATAVAVAVTAPFTLLWLAQGQFGGW